VCRALNLSKRALQNYRVKGIIPSSMLGGKVYFRESDIAELMKSGLTKAKS
jgi:DNA-binding transcriptional MerR regulator